MRSANGRAGDVEEDDAAGDADEAPGEDEDADEEADDDEDDDEDGVDGGRATCACALGEEQDDDDVGEPDDVAPCDASMETDEAVVVVVVVGDAADGGCDV
jgi:hypothetical protein